MGNKYFKRLHDKGYAINQKRLEAQNKTIEIQSRIIASTLELNEIEVFNVIQQYSDVLMLLDDYDYFFSFYY